MDRQLASTADARRFLEERLTALRAKLEQSERDVVSYASKNGIITLETVHDAQGKTEAPRTIVASDLEALNNALNAATADRIAAASRANAALAVGLGLREAAASLESSSSSAAAQRPKLSEAARELAQVLASSS